MAITSNIRSAWQRFRPSTSKPTATSQGSSSSAVKFHNQVTHPLVSAFLLYTDQHRAAFATRAITEFTKQAWPYKEMLVMNATGADLAVSAEDVRVVSIKTRYRGELKNLAVYNSKGEWCFPWPDDCNFEPDYMEWHMFRRSKSSPVVVDNPHGKSLPSGQLAQIDPRDATFCSFHRFNQFSYDHDGDDFNFVSKWPRVDFIDSDTPRAVRLFRDYGD